MYLKNKCKNKMCCISAGAIIVQKIYKQVNWDSVLCRGTLKSHSTLLNHMAFRSHLNTSHILVFQSKLLYLSFYIKVAFTVHVMTNETSVN